ncbi:thiamine diphosphokinase [Roseicyclus sediminis]|uniref:thiamine diphosphokinase n=1 Tax=Roseicyclus sediminis TaxID=2980997 RepID=UPI00292A53E2|nr:thiamine diphosphokinase [Roseibacterium sp. SDUM158016]
MNGQKMPPERPVVAGAQAATLLGGGVLGPRDLAEAMAVAPVLVAADGGADAAIAAGIVPRAVIGDLDSLSDAARARLPADILYQITEQESTDFDKALRRLQVPLVLAVGFTGGRLDHELAVYHTLATRPEHRCIVFGGLDIVFHAPPTIELDLPQGTRVSLFPMAGVTGRSRGLLWPIDGLELHPARRIGTSNAATGGTVEIVTDGPGLLIILPRETLPAAVAALGARPRGAVNV